MDERKMEQHGDNSLLIGSMDGDAKVEVHYHGEKQPSDTVEKNEDAVKLPVDDPVEQLIDKAEDAKIKSDYQTALKYANEALSICMATR